MRKTRTIAAATIAAATIAAATIAAATIAAGTYAATSATAAAPNALVTSTGGEAVCPAAGQAPVTAPDGTVCANASGVYLITHSLGATPVTVQATLRAPYRGFVAAVSGATQIAVTVGRPTAAGTLYTGPLRVFWYAAA